MAEGPLATTINKLVNNWFPHKESATAFGFANCGLPLGGAVAGPVVGLLTATYGWRVAFAAIACLGLLWLIFWQFMATDKPHQHPRVSDDERRLIESDRSVPEDPSDVQRLGFYLKQPAILAAMISYFGYSYILFFFLTWFPSFLMMDRHLSLKSMSLATVLPWLLGFIGYGLSGVLSDFVFRRTGNALRARKRVLIVCLGTAGVCVTLAGAVTTTASALLLMAIAVFALYLSGSTYWALIQDTIPGPRLGSVGGCVHAIANCAGDRRAGCNRISRRAKSYLLQRVCPRRRHCACQRARRGNTAAAAFVDEAKVEQRAGLRLNTHAHPRIPTF